MQPRWSSAAPGIFAFSRLDRGERREFVVALNNAETAKTAACRRTWSTPSSSSCTARARGSVRSDRDSRLSVTVGPLSAVVYRAKRPLAHVHRAPSISLRDPGDQMRDRAEIRADVSGDGFNEVTFYARAGWGGWTPIGTDDNAPYRVFHDVSDFAPGTRIAYKAVVGDRATGVRTGTVAPPAIALEAPDDGGRVRGKVEVRATATPDRNTYSATFLRSVNGGAWTAIGTDSSQPVYTAFDDTTGLADGSVVAYKAVLTYAPGRTTESAPRSVTVVAAPVANAIVHYRRPAGDYADWGLHLWGDAVDPAVLATVAWDKPFQRTGTDAFGAVYSIPIKDDTQAVNFIMHRPSGDTVPDTREPGGDRSFVPLDHPEIWLVQGDPAVYFSPPGQ